MKKSVKKPTPPGGFYAIQPIPSVSGHIKLGYSANFQKRLKQYYTLCPDARIVRAWPCLLFSNERLAMEMVERKGFRRVGTEVFQVDDLAAFFCCLDEFFLEVQKDELRKSSRRREPEEKLEIWAQQLLKETNEAALALNRPLDIPVIVPVSASGPYIMSRPMPEIDRLVYSVEDVAAWLGESYETVYSWIQAGKIHHVKVGRLVRIPRKELERLSNTA